MPKTWTTYNGTEAITWQVVGGIARAVQVERDIIATITKPLPQCKRCRRNSATSYNARHCTACRQIVSARQALKRDRARRHPCADCGELVGRQAKRCQTCAQRHRHQEARRAA